MQEGDRCWDVLIVGGGPTGSAAALRALQRRPGAAVAIVDAAAFPRDKACGDGIAVHALDVLRDLGVTGVTDGYAPVDRLRLRAPGADLASAARSRPPYEAVMTVRRANYVIPRTVFDARLHAAAVARGAQPVRARVRAVAVRGDRVVCETTTGPLSARVVVGADGANSQVRRQLGIGANPEGTLAIAVRGYAAAADAAPEQLIHMVDEGWPAYAWSFPIGDGRANIGYGKMRTRLDGPGRAQLHGELARLLPSQPAEPGSLRAHHLPLSTWRPRQPDGRILLAGDAASLINPLTGEGIFYALLSGTLAGAAAVDAAAGGPDPGVAYRAALARELGRHLRHTALVARLAARRPLVDAAVRLAARHPELHDGMVEMGLGSGTVPVGALPGLVRGAVRERIGRHDPVR